MIDTVFVAIGVLIYLSNLKNKSRGLEDDDVPERPSSAHEPVISTPAVQFPQRGGTAEGEAVITGVEEEVIPVIMASVSAFSKIPLSSLNVKSIKKLSE
jgi:hypothetical protein